MASYIATEACTFKPNTENWAAPPVVSGLGFAKMKAEGSPVLCDTLSIQCPTWAQGPSDVTPGVAAGPFIFAATAQKLKAGGKLVLLEGDESASVVVTWANAPPNIPSRTANIILKIENAGQTKVRAL